MHFLGQAIALPVKHELPLSGCSVAAGFPSPADDYIESALDLNEFLVLHPAATFFVRVSGDSMIDAGILDGDYLIVDRAVEAKNGAIVIAVIEGEFTVKRFCQQFRRIELRAENADYPPILIAQGQELQIWGVVIGVFRKV